MELQNIQQLLFGLTRSMAVMALAAYLLSLEFDILPSVIKRQATLKMKLFLIVFFGGLSIAGTYLGTYIQGAYANIRAIGAFIGGLLGGPTVGLSAGLIGGGHRFFLGGFTAVPCALATILAGLAGAAVYYYRPLARISAGEGFLLGVGIESLEMILVLALSRSYPRAVELVLTISLPMILSNAVGIYLFISILKKSLRRKEKVKALQSHKALKIANKSLCHLKSGLNKESAQKTAEIVLDVTEVAAVAITDRSKVLAYCGAGSDHHHAGEKVLTQATKQALETGKIHVIANASELGCPHEDCPLASAVIAPLKRGEQIIGSLKLYKTEPEEITELDRELAEGIARLLSTQLHISSLKEEAKLATQAELKALQAQIRPHFLFNSLNTIISFCRTDPERARGLLRRLSKFLRATFRQETVQVTLEEELDCVRHYVGLAQARFGSQLQVEFSVPEELLSYKLPSFTIQPLVENAIKHGISPKVGSGQVTVDIERQKDDLLVAVADNGVGIPQAEQNKLLAETNEDYGIGLKNVHQRLKWKYGTDYGLEIKSAVGQGTKVEFRLPVEERGDSSD